MPSKLPQSAGADIPPAFEKHMLWGRIATWPDKEPDKKVKESIDPKKSQGAL